MIAETRGALIAESDVGAELVAAGSKLF
jgi:hypothetical protein